MKSAYIMHPYWDKDETVRADNVRLAGELATEVLSHGFAVFSPLQMSQGIEDALGEASWLQHGMYWLTKCDFAVRPEYWANSNGCKAESAMAKVLGRPVLDAWYGGGRWALNLDELDKVRS